MQALWKVPKERKKERTLVKRLIYLATAALVAMLILVPAAMAQEMTVEQEKTTIDGEGSPQERRCAGRVDTLAGRSPARRRRRPRLRGPAAQVASE